MWAGFSTLHHQVLQKPDNGSHQGQACLNRVGLKKKGQGTLRTKVEKHCFNVKLYRQ